MTHSQASKKQLPPSSREVHRYTVKVLSGAYEGSECPLSPEKPLVIGRSQDLDMVLLEDDKVSRQHARLIIQGDRVALDDMGSTNGTHLNGRRIESAYVTPGDRIRIGSTVMEIVGWPEGAEESEPHIRSDLRSTRKRSLMSGFLEELSVPSMLQLLRMGRKSCIVSCKTESSTAMVTLLDGQFVTASVEGHRLSPEDAFFHILGWEEGSFHVTPYEQTGDDTKTRPLDQLLIEGFERIAHSNDGVSDQPTPVFEPRNVSAEQMDLCSAGFSPGPIESLDQAVALASALTGYSPSDWELIKPVATLIQAWMPTLVGSYAPLWDDPAIGAALFGADADVPDRWRQKTEDLMEGWLLAMVSTEAPTQFWSKVWATGFLGLRGGVPSLLLAAILARLQQSFRGQCFEVFEASQAVAVGDAFSRITATATAVATAAHEAGILATVQRIGITDSLFRKMESQVIANLLPKNS